MATPPGPTYLLQNFPAFFIPSAIVYAFFWALREQGVISVPTWLVVLLSIFAKPVSFVINRYYAKNYRWPKEARAMGAELMPIVEGSPFVVMKAIITSFRYGYPCDIFFEWTEKYGNSFLFPLPLEYRVLTCEPEHIKALLATQFEEFAKGPTLFTQMKSLLGVGVFNSDGDMWKFHRSMTRPFFTKERISDFEIFDEHAAVALKLAKDRLDQGYPIDFQDLVSRFTLDSATQFLFGRNVDSLSAGLDYPEYSHLANSAEFLNHPSNKFVTSFMSGQGHIALRSRAGPSWPLTEFWKDKIRPHRKVVDTFVEPILNEAIERKKARKDAGGIEKAEADEPLTLLDHLINETEDKTVLMDELVNLLVAGRDTTASTLTFGLYMMAEHPDIARRLREEILSIVGPSAQPTYEDMRNMKYLRAFLNEVLRLYPAVPINSRTSREATAFQSKTPGLPALYVPAQTRVVYSVFMLHRRTDLWGPDALKFDPDRFIDERLHKYLTPNPFIFCPFNAGPRICLGQQFAYHESSFFLVRLLQQFSSFELVLDAFPKGTLPPPSWKGAPGTKGTDKILPKNHLTMYSNGGLWVRMKEAKHNDMSL